MSPNGTQMLETVDMDTPTMDPVESRGRGRGRELGKGWWAGGLVAGRQRRNDTDARVDGSDLCVVMCVHVDPTRRDVQTRSVDLLRRTQHLEVRPDCDDQIAGHRDVSHARWAARALHHHEEIKSSGINLP